jgi:spermidine synthase
MSKGGPRLPTGTTVRVMFQECQCDSAYLNQPETVIPLMQKAIRAVKLNDLNFTHWAFDGGGSTLAFILSESHVAMHTWPEYDHMVLIDVSVCDFRLSNRARTIALCDKFADIFQPRKILREVEDMIPRLEEMTPQGVSLAVEVESVVEMRRSAYQDILIADTKGYGRTLVLDGVFQVGERDHEFYTEPMVHIPLLEVESPRRVLVCGGADGASARHVLMHPSVEQCVVVDFDADVLDMSRTHLSALHRGCFDDPRCECVANAASDWIRTNYRERAFDAIIFDTNDPGSAADELFSETLLGHLQEMLAEDGVLALHIGAPSQYPEIAKKLVARVVERFGCVYPYWSFVPIFGTYLVWLLCYKSKAGHLSALPVIQRRLDERELSGKTRVVSWDTYHAAFCIPPCMRPCLPGVRFYHP